MKSKIKNLFWYFSFAIIVMMMETYLFLFPIKFENPHNVTGEGMNMSHVITETLADNQPSNAAKNPTQYSDSQLEQPNMYPHWVQYWGPWAGPFGGVGHGGTNWGGSNYGCVVTSIAIQTARAGAKTKGGKPFNPLTMTGGNPYAQLSYSFDNGSCKENSPQCGSGYGTATSHTLSDQDALQQCQKYADAGYYPLIRCGHTPSTAANHTVAFWKGGNGKPLVYDPARSAAGGWGKYWSYVGYLDVQGQGIQKYSPNSPGPDDQVGGGDQSTSSSSNSNSNSGKQQNQNNQTAPIKPIFNPFRTPVLRQLPADQIGNGQLMDNTKYMQLADGYGPQILSFVRSFAILLIYVYMAIGIFGVCIKYFDEQSGEIISDLLGDHISGTAQSILMPNGNLFGLEGYNIRDIIISFVKKFGIISIVLILVASGFLSRAISWCLMGLTKLGINSMF